MSDQPIGIFAALQARHSAVVANLSPTARHAAFPRVYARPMPPPTIEKDLADLRTANAAHLKEIGELRDTIASLQAQLTTPTILMARRIAERKNEPADVIEAFLCEINAQRAEGDPEWTMGHLTSARRARPIVMPRHVCIWLVRQLCTQVSLPRIGKYFGNRDHTSCMHACVRTPHWLLIDPRMKLVADAVLLRFGGTAT